MRQPTKAFRNVSSWQGSQPFIEESNRVCIWIRLGLRKRRRCVLDCCCHRNSCLVHGGGAQQCRFVVLSISFSVDPLPDVRRTVLKLHAIRLAISHRSLSWSLLAIHSVHFSG